MTNLQDNKEQNTEPNNIIKNLLIIGGEKGGVGKSFFTRYLLAHIVAQKGEKEIVCYDADPSVDDVYQIFSRKDWMKKAYLSDNKLQVNEAYKIFKDKKPTVIVNLPSNIRRNFHNFCEENGLFDQETQKEIYETCYYFFISDGSFQSIKLLSEHLDKYQNKEFIKTILILNAGQNGNSYDFSYLNNEEGTLGILKEQLEKSKNPVLIFPELSPALRFNVDALMCEESIEFNELITNPEHLDTLRRMNFRKYMKNLDTFFHSIIKWKDNSENPQGDHQIESIKYQELVNSQEKRRKENQLFSEAA